MNEILAVTLRSMQLDMAKVDRVGLNLANAQTTGYKREVVVGETFGSRVAAARHSAAASAPEHTTQVDQRPGTLRSTGQSLDVALTGPGWFEVQTERGLAYTRQGDFRLDAQGRIVTQQGQPVMGLAGEIQLPHGFPVIDPQGRVFEGTAPGGAPPAADAPPVSQLKVVQFEAGAAVEHLGQGLVAVRGEVAAAADGRTEVRQGYLENSNVSSMQEMVQLIQTLRHFESMQKAATGYDEMLGTAIRKLGDAA
ncbi:flagellar hook-basal body protein [Ramlibacter humi]|uniref:Flagellar hook-basal body protein n=1 Tax=Ramlibacter humi TaxID=2530451 RepID=A0A4Z0BEH9_9BURK|nr:flagellar hook-basal body protein [Ramlibacter humi]TFY97091.1 flagellar hook-basal body protein [Ramlibacter humi]